MSTLNGTTFNDINFNGIFDAGDKALPGVTVFLDSNSNGLPDTAEKIAATEKELLEERDSVKHLL